MSLKLTLYTENDEYLQLEGLHDELTGDYITNAVVTCTVYDAAGEAVTNATNLTLTYAADAKDIDGVAVEGAYRALVPHTFNPEQGSYYAYVKAVASGLQMKEKVKIKVVERA